MAASPRPPRRFERSGPNQPRQLDLRGPPEVGRRRVVTLSTPDDHGRHPLALRPRADMTYATTRAALREVFGDAGMPEASPCDNASSARNTGVGLPGLDARPIRLGIRPMHGRADRPQAQGKVERSHGTPGREAWPEAGRDLPEGFQADLGRWRPASNPIRPHEAPGDEPPVTRWAPGPRRRPDAVPGVSHPADAEVRTVGPEGSARWHRSRIRVGVGPSGERARVDDQGHQVEVDHGAYRARVIAAARPRPGETAQAMV